MPVQLPAALAALLDVVRCPTCGAPLAPSGGSLHCPGRHTFDIARQGYAGLLTGARATSGDDGDMVRARDRFLATGKYARIRDAVARVGARDAPDESTVVDVGCGTGYYLAGVLERLPGSRGLGLDTSVPALRSTARVHERAAAASWDVFRPLPLADGTVDVVLDVFAPRNPSEFHRVLREQGRLVVVRPTGRHLIELQTRVRGLVAIDPAKERRLHRVLAPFFEVVGTEPVEHAMSLTGPEVADLIGMTPSARHRTGPSSSDPAPDLQVTVSVLVTAYRPRRRPPGSRPRRG